MLRSGEPAALIARRVDVSKSTPYCCCRDEFLVAGEAALASDSGKKGDDPRDRRNGELEQQMEKRDRVIGECMIANRKLKELSGQSL